MHVPNEIKVGDPILADFLNDIVRGLAQRTPLDGVGLRWTRTAQGFLPSVPGGGSGTSDEIFWGKPTSAYTGSASQITLDPCDPAGTDNGSANVAVYLLASQGSLDIGGRSLGTNEIVAYVFGDDGNAYVLGEPFKAIGSRDVYTGYIGTAYVIGLATTSMVDELAPDIKFGKPTGAFTGPDDEIELDPCTPYGTDSGEALITAKFRASVDISNVDVGATTNVTDCQVGTSEIIPIALNNDGDWVVLYKDPTPILTYGPKMDSGNLVARYRMDFGWFRSSESAEKTLVTTEESEVTACNETPP